MTATAESSALAGTLGRYELIHEIASGGMATVYLARARGVAGFERIVAIKCCHPHLRREEEFADMFLDEARLAARIHHPNVVPTLDVGESENGSLYLVMDVVDGFSLAQLSRALRKQDRLMPVPVALRIMIDALSGLHAAHELRDGNDKPLNLVHRDVSPQNILVGADGVARITDFGVAKAEERLATTREGLLKGKLSYMAPEQIGLNAVVTRRADLYPAGVVLWELLTGGRLFDGRSDAETLNLVLRGSVRPPSEVRAEVGADIDAIVMRALERDPAKRYETALEIADALESCSVRPATARVAGAFIQESLADSFKRRRDLLRRCLDAAPIVIERPPLPPQRTDDERALKSIAPTRRSRPTLYRRRQRSRMVWGALATVVTLGAALAAHHFFMVDRHPDAAVNALRVVAGVVPHAEPRNATNHDPGGPIAENNVVVPNVPATNSAPVIAPDAAVASNAPSDAAPEPTHHHHHQRDASSQNATTTRFTPHSI